MNQLYNTYKDIPKRTRNAISKRLISIEKKHGFDALRKVALKYFDEIKEKQDLQNQIAEAEQKLKELREKKR